MKDATRTLLYTWKGDWMWWPMVGPGPCIMGWCGITIYGYIVANSCQCSINRFCIAMLELQCNKHKKNALGHQLCARKIAWAYKYGADRSIKQPTSCIAC